MSRFLIWVSLLVPAGNGKEIGNGNMLEGQLCNEARFRWNNFKQAGVGPRRRSIAQTKARDSRITASYPDLRISSAFPIYWRSSTAPLRSSYVNWKKHEKARYSRIPHIYLSTESPMFILNTAIKSPAAGLSFAISEMLIRSTVGIRCVVKERSVTKRAPLRSCTSIMIDL